MKGPDSKLFSWATFSALAICSGVAPRWRAIGAARRRLLIALAALALILLLAAALLGVLASAGPAGAAPTAKGPKPTVTDFTATPTTLYDNGGMVTLSSGGLTLSTVLEDHGRWPQIDNLIPAESNYQSELGAFHAPYLARMAKILPPVVKREGATWECLSMSATRTSLWRRVQHYDARPRGAWTATALFLQMPVRIK